MQNLDNERKLKCLFSRLKGKFIRQIFFFNTESKFQITFPVYRFYRDRKESTDSQKPTHLHANEVERERRYFLAKIKSKKKGTPSPS